MSTPVSPAEQRTHFLKLLRKFHSAMLVTQTGEHGFHSRPMMIAQVEDDGRTWFFTSKDSAKVHEIAMDSHVHLTAQDGDSAFLTLSGRASLVEDRGKIEELWSEPVRVWFPGGKDDPAIELIAIDPERGEFWDVTGSNRVKYYWEAAKAYVTGSTPETEDGRQHARVPL